MKIITNIFIFFVALVLLSFSPNKVHAATQAPEDNDQTSEGDAQRPENADVQMPEVGEQTSDVDGQTSENGDENRPENVAAQPPNVQDTEIVEYLVLTEELRHQQRTPVVPENNEDSSHTTCSSTEGDATNQQEVAAVDNTDPSQPACMSMARMIFELIVKFFKSPFTNSRQAGQYFYEAIPNYKRAISNTCKGSAHLFIAFVVAAAIVYGADSAAKIFVDYFGDDKPKMLTYFGLLSQTITELIRSGYAYYVKEALILCLQSIIDQTTCQPSYEEPIVYTNCSIPINASCTELPNGAYYCIFPK